MNLMLLLSALGALLPRFPRRSLLRAVLLLVLVSLALATCAAEGAPQ